MYANAVCSPLIGLLLVLFYRSNLTSPFLFWAEHVWDSRVEVQDLCEDWGKYSAITCCSLQPTTLEYLHPRTWLFLGPSTIDYHAEHTMFPSLNYCYYPRIAPIVEQTMRDH